jgi:hypothetical protein
MHSAKIEGCTSGSNGSITENFCNHYDSFTQQKYAIPIRVLGAKPQEEITYISIAAKVVSRKAVLRL